MIKHIASVAGIGLAVAFVAIFFIGRKETQQLTQVAPRVGMSVDELLAIGPRVASQSGVTLGSSRHVVYLLACSGQSSRATLEGQATQAGTLARRQRLSDREAVVAVLERSGIAAGAGSLNGC